ncbi:peptidase [Bacillus salitolerans]|uniref:Peptidase n=1 Tax=Bacillus salitolerans TaxID=1437434 RepID=A0ABW4LT81_9BACI
MLDVDMRVKQWLQLHRLKGIRLLQRLVQENSISGHEASAQAIVVEKLRELGLQIDIWEPNISNLQQHPYFVSPRTTFVGSPNVVAVKKGLGGGRSIILNGHIDVVPEGDISGWELDPFSAKIIDGKMYGRGTSDMKGGSISLLLALEAIQALDIPLRGDVIFQSVIEEESGGAGSLAAITRGYKADVAIIPEPTNMKIFPKQQGSMWFKLVVKGKSAHGGTRYEGVSAIEKAMTVHHKVLELEKTRNATIHDPLYQSVPIPVPINIGKIYGGNWPSSVADEVTMEGRMGVAPDEKMENVQKELEKHLALLAEIDPWFKDHPVELKWFGARWVPGTIDSEHDAMKVLSKHFTKVKNRAPIIEASPWGTDGGLFTQVGNIPTIVFGPGTTEVAHYPNEYIEIERVFDTAEIIANMIIEWCQ